MSLPSWKRSLCCTFVLGMLVALGVGVYRLTPPEPVGAADIGETHPRGFVGSGASLVTLSPKWKDDHDHTSRIENGVKTTHARPYFRQLGPLQVWDMHTGARIMEFFKDQKFRAHAKSSDLRFFAAELCKVDPTPEAEPADNRLLVLIDLVAGTRIDVPLSDTMVASTLTFSSDGKLLARLSEKLHAETDKDPRVLSVYETATGRLLYQCESMGLFNGAFIASEVLLHYAPTKGEQKNIQFLNPWTGDVTRTLEVGDKTFASSDNRFLVENRSLPDDLFELMVWNLRTNVMDTRLESPGIHSISQDGRYLIRSGQEGDGQPVTVCGLPTGKPLGMVPGVPFGEFQIWACFSSDERFLAVRIKEPKEALVMFELPTMKMLWKRETEATIVPRHFGPGSNILYVIETSPRAVHAIDCATGGQLATIELSDDERLLGSPRVSASTMVDSGAVLVHGFGGKDKHPALIARLRNWLPWLRLPEAKNDIVVVLDGATARERLRLTGHDTTRAMLSPDGRWLVTGTGNDQVLRLWDVDARKPLHWAIGVSAGLGTLIVLAGWWRARRSRWTAEHGGAGVPT